jgi:hypothetical protein
VEGIPSDAEVARADANRRDDCDSFGFARDRPLRARKQNARSRDATRIGWKLGARSLSLRQELVFLDHGRDGNPAIACTVFHADHASFALHTDALGERDLRRQRKGKSDR